MRKYIYRGKNKNNKKWVYGYFVKGVQDDEAYIITNHNWLYRLCLKTTMACHVDEMQRTVGRTGIAW